MYEDDARLRDLCEKASKELDHDKLINLVRQISELPEKRKRKPEANSLEKKTLPVLRSPGGDYCAQAPTSGGRRVNWDRPGRCSPARRGKHAPCRLFTSAGGHAGSSSRVPRQLGS